MSRSRVLFFLLSLGSLLVVVGAGLSRAATGGAEGDDSLSKQLSVFSEVLSLIRRAYVEEASFEVLLDGAMNGVTDALDPLAVYVPAAAIEDFEKTLAAGARYSGLTVTKERGIAYVVAVEPGSPAETAGFRKGDVIAEVDGRSTRTMPVWRLRTLFAGEPGRSLEVELLRRGQSRRATLTLAEFERPATRREEVDGVAVVRLRRFDAAAVREMQEILRELAAAGAGKLALDLRQAAGGEVEAAYQIAGLFASGALGELATPDEAPRTGFASGDDPLWGGSLVVMIDGGTLGAAEVLAAVLQQKAGASLVGQRSFGHAGRQAFKQLSNGSRLLVTDAYYTGPDGEAIDEGLAPDVAVNESFGPPAEGEAPPDQVLERAIEVLAGGDTPLKQVA